MYLNASVIYAIITYSRGSRQLTYTREFTWTSSTHTPHILASIHCESPLAHTVVYIVVR